MNVFLLGTLLVVAVWAAIMVAYASRIRRVNRTYADLAWRLQGQFAAAGLLRHPAILFPLQGRSAWLGTEPENAGPEGIVTLFRVEWADRELELQVVPGGMLSRLAGWLGNRRIAVGVPHFDRHFSVRGNAPERARAVLGAGVLVQLEQLARLANGRGLRLTIRRGQLEVRVRGSLDRGQDLARFARLCVELTEQAWLADRQGIEILSEQVAPHDPSVACRVCGDALGADVVYCRACRTPHHYDCWKYAGVCSIFGCGETRYLAGRRARRIIGPVDDRQVRSQDQPTPSLSSRDAADEPRDTANAPQGATGEPRGTTGERPDATGERAGSSGPDPERGGGE